MERAVTLRDDRALAEDIEPILRGFFLLVLFLLRLFLFSVFVLPLFDVSLRRGRVVAVALRWTRRSLVRRLGRRIRVVRGGSSAAKVAAAPNANGPGGSPAAASEDDTAVSSTVAKMTRGIDRILAAQLKVRQ